MKIVGEKKKEGESLEPTLYYTFTIVLGKKLQVIKVEVKER